MQLRHLAGAIAFVAFVLLVLACGGRVNVPPPPPGNDALPKDEPPPKDGPKGIPKVETPRDPANEKPDLVWMSEDLIKDYHGNGSLYRQKYANKIVELSGTVWDFDPFGYYGPKDLINVNLQASRGFIICHMADREPWAKVVPGQPVKVRGRVPRDDEQIVEPLVQCVVVEPRQSPAPQLTAEQLCRDARADPKKYTKQYMIVSGEVTAKSKVNALYLELKGDDQTKVRCQIVDKLKFTIDPIMVGQKIKVFGQYVTINPPGLPGAVILGKALPITKDVQ